MNRPLQLFTATTLPILFLIGCATTETGSLSDSITDEINHETIASQDEQANVNESVKLAIHNMEAYQKQLEQAQSEPVATVIEEEAPVEITTTEEEPEMTVLIVEDGIDIAEMTETLSPAESEIIDQQISHESISDSMPDKADFFFGFNKTEPTEADKEILKQHANYLQKHPSLVLVISGHADNRGNKNYNQYLSELRAQKVASVLIASGVPEHQLRVGGMGDNVPMANERNWAENRRVELLYRDVMMLSSQ